MLRPVDSVADHDRSVRGSVELRLAAIDVGSNSLHMIIAQADPDGGLTTLWRMKEMVGLGRMSFPSHKLSPAAIDAAVGTLGRFQQAAQRRQCEKIIAVATSAVREAENGGDFIERAKQELGLTVRVVSAREEARLIYLGIRHAANFKSYPNLMIDIGGGSVEFIVADREKPLLLESRKLGAARMTARFVNSDPISDADLRAMLGHYDQELAPLVKQIKALQPVSAVASSGTMENLAAMSAAMFGGDPEIVQPKPFRQLVERLLRSTTAQRAKMAGLDDQRKDQVIAGALLVQQLIDRLELREIQMVRAALREGIALDYISRHIPELKIRRDVPDIRRRSVLDLARRCDWHELHSKQVCRLTMMLFDELQSLHRLGDKERELIEYGALLHDIGWHISKDGHHKHSLYLILNGGLKGFASEEIGIIANVARYHRKSEPKPSHEAFEALSSHAKKVVRVGAALLRIADGLDRSHASVVSGLKVRIGKDDTVDVSLKGRSDIELELWGARRKTDMFRSVFKHDIKFSKG